ncbi:MAG: gliding motility-associated C-terminal domain-containing protein [Bacteroidetes bacterium]|nr:gliding motility-associated C-terminal domain-containing protein [Bacteroidota bacterium]
MNWRKVILSILLLYSGSTVICQDCETHFDLSTWSKKGAPNADWEVLDTNHVIGSIDAIASSYFVSQQNMINVLIKGTISVQTNTDHDFVGLVFGYHSPTTLAENNDYKFYLFDWKGESENCTYEGFRLSHYNGYINLNGQKSYMYCNYNSPPLRSLLAEKYNDTLGWIAYTEYQIELLYTSNLITIKVDDKLMFERSGSFESGKFGFYCMSQRQIHFKNFTYQSFIDFVPAPSSACIGENIILSLYDPIGSGLPDFVQEVFWDFGDGNTSQEIIPSHSYYAAGDYDIELIVVKDGGCTDTIVKNVTIYPYPIVDLGNDIDLPACSSVLLEAANPGASYLWSTGETNETIELIDVPKDTAVWVVVNKHGCTGSDTVLIKVEEIQYQLYFPNAFTPNNDGKNDLFAPVGNTNNVTIYQLIIYNRWGQQIFESSNPDVGWDGKYNGNLSTIGTYIYKVSYRMDNCGGKEDYSKLTTLTLIN